MHGEPTAYGMPPDATETVVTEFIALAGAGVREHWHLLSSHGPVLPAPEAGVALPCLRRLIDRLPQLAGDVAASAAAVHAFVLELLALRRQAHALAMTPVERAVEDLLRSPTAAVPLKTIAERHGVSREHLTRSFIARVGSPPGAWLSRARLERALALLMHTRLPMGEIARQAGYSSTHTLARQVRAVTGAPPSARRAPAPGEMALDLVDTHCHLTHQRFAPDLSAVLAHARAAGVARMVTIGTSLADARACHALSQAHAGVVFCSAGLDPSPASMRAMPSPRSCSSSRRCCAQAASAPWARSAWSTIIRSRPSPPSASISSASSTARALGLPAILHVREAHADMLPLLREHPRAHGVVHSFDGGPQEAEGYLAAGWHLAINGMATFKGRDQLRAAVPLIPDDRILVETDSPYLAPVPMRGQRCEPAFVAHTLGALAALRGQQPAALAALTTANAERLFRLGTV